MSQQGISILSLSVLASGAVTEYRAVGFDGAQATVSGQKVLGIAEQGATNGTYLRVCRNGTAVAEAGAAFVKGAALVTDAVGRLVTATALTVAAGATAVTSAAANGAGSIAGSEPPQYIVAYALQAAGAAGDLCEVVLA